MKYFPEDMLPKKEEEEKEKEEVNFDNKEF